MKLLERWRLVIGLVLMALVLLFFVLVLISLYDRPDPVPSRQVIQNSLPLQEVWRKKNVGLGPQLINVNSTTIVIANQDTPSYQYRLQALELETGKLRWEVPSSPNIGAHSLLIKDNRVYAAVNWEIQAYQLSDGKLLWQTPAEPRQRTGYTLAWSNNNLVNYSSLLGEDYLLLSEYEPTTGALVRQEKVSMVQPLLATDTVQYQGVCGKLAAIDLLSGGTKWQTQLSGCPLKPTLVASDLLLATTDFLSRTAQLYLIDTSTGRVKWNALKDNLVSNFAVIDQTVYAIRRNGSIIGLDLTTGQKVGTIDVTPNQTNTSRYSYWLLATDQKLIAYYGDSRDLIVFQQGF